MHDQPSKHRVPQRRVGRSKVHFRTGCRPGNDAGVRCKRQGMPIVPTCQIGAPDLNACGTPSPLTNPPPAGIKAISAERHWRHRQVGQHIVVCIIGIKAISAERHWRHWTRARRSAAENPASKPSQPKGIGDDGASVSCVCLFVGHQSHLSRKALETS